MNLDERNKELSGNLSNYFVHQIVIDQKNGQKCIIVQKSKTSICVHISKDEQLYDIEAKCEKCQRTSILKKEQSKKCKQNVFDMVQVAEHEWKVINKICDGKLVETRKIYSGVDCNQWFDIKKFEERFINLPYQEIPKSDKLLNLLNEEIILVRLINQCTEQLEIPLVQQDPFLLNYINGRKKEYEEKITKLTSYTKDPNLGEGIMFKLEKRTTFFYYPMVNREEKQLSTVAKVQLEKSLLENLTKITNRSRNQTVELFELCDFDFYKLLELERKIKNNHTGCPGDKETVEEILKMGEGSGWFKLTFLMCQPKCCSKEFPTLIGSLSKELDAKPGKWNEQWGIHWSDISKFLNDETTKKLGVPLFWQDKNDIEFIITE